MGIKFVNAHVGYEDSIVLRNIDCTLDPPAILLGPNGSGKTTLIRAVLGLADIISGRLYVDDKPIEDIHGTPGLVIANLEEIYHVLYLPVKDLARLYLDVIGGDYDMFLTYINEFRLRDKLSRPLVKLSAGERKLVLNFIALASKCKYVLLDEPFENLDPSHRVKMLNIILEHSSRIIMSTHVTWLLSKLVGWKAFLVVQGRVYGPVDAATLPTLSVVKGSLPNAVLTFEIGGRTYSLVHGDGIRLSAVDSLDRLYEIIVGESV